MAAVQILAFTDVLCIWAYVTQIRLDQLEHEFEDDVDIRAHFCSVFGNVPGKIANNWADRGGAAGYGAHVRKVASEFEHAKVHEDVWGRVQPVSSMPSHLSLCGVRHLEKQGTVEPGTYYALCRRFRIAFFEEARDVSLRRVQCELLEAASVPRDAVEATLDLGSAHAELASDLEDVRQFDVKLSPSLLLNEGRQRLNGNVGYRVIEANVRELLHRRAADEASWC